MRRETQERKIQNCQSNEFQCLDAITNPITIITMIGGLLLFDWIHFHHGIMIIAWAVYIFIHMS